MVSQNRHVFLLFPSIWSWSCFSVFLAFSSLREEKINRSEPKHCLSKCIDPVAIYFASHIASNIVRKTTSWGVLDSKTQEKQHALNFLVVFKPSLFPPFTRIEAKHQELRDRQARDRFVPPDVEDDDVDPNYARINAFRGRPSPSQSPYGTRSPSPQRATHPTDHSREPSTEDPLDSLYAKINKPRGPTLPAADRWETHTHLTTVISQ